MLGFGARAMLCGVRITKYTHSCVRLEHAGGTLVIDPGSWSEPEALDGADAVLVTHEHGDHADPRRLAALSVPVYAPTTARVPGLDTVGVAAGEEFTAAGFTVTAHGGSHAPTYGGRPDCANLGYLVDGALYHPGDALHVPAEPVETLLVPLQASWLKTAEAVDFVHAVAPRRAFGIHEGQLNARGLNSVNGWLTEECADRYRYLPPQTSA